MAYTAIDDSEAYFQVEIYTGNEGTQSVTFDGTTNMQPDLIWIKSRTNAASHVLTDAARGVNSQLYAEGNWAAGTYTNMVTAFGSDGFTMGLNASVNGAHNYVAWCWKGGTTSGIDTTNTTITPDAYSFNATSGVSIIKYDGNGTSGAKVAHGLGAIPEVVITKTVGSANSWAVYHHKMSSAPETDYMFLDTTVAPADDAGYWNDTTPTQYNVVLGGTGNTNGTGGDNPIVGYCFASKQGFSNFGVYTGNGDADGAYIHLGFRPAMVITKEITGTQGWSIIDNKRSPFNPTDGTLHPNASAVEDTGSDFFVDLLANGFKIRQADNAFNGDGKNYIYCAWAEAPIVNSEGVPGNAR